MALPAEKPAPEVEVQVEAEESPEALASEIGEKLAKLSDMVSPEEKAKLEEVMAMLSGMGSEPAEPDVVSAQGGPKGMPMGPQGRM